MEAPLNRALHLDPTLRFLPGWRDLVAHVPWRAIGSNVDVDFDFDFDFSIYLYYIPLSSYCRHKFATWLTKVPFLSTLEAEERGAVCS